MLGFADYGDADAATYGVGVRYRIAERLGLDIGLDHARGPEEGVVYIPFGHVWGSRMG